MNFNYSIENYKRSILESIQQSQLPIGVIYYLFKDVMAEVEQVYNHTIQAEFQQMNSAIAEAPQTNDEVKKEE